jgi:hypothetical protein
MNLIAQMPKQASYRNTVLFADYSDPDVIRDGDNYYLVSSSFGFVPGIPILQSNDLVHWTIIGHVLPRVEIDPRYDMVGGNRYGRGVWAPSIRRHNGLFYVYFPTPDEGIFMSTAAKIPAPWSASRKAAAGPSFSTEHAPDGSFACPYYAAISIAIKVTDKIHLYTATDLVRLSRHCPSYPNRKLRDRCRLHIYHAS